MNANAATTGALIAEARKEKGLTQKALAQELHVSVQAVSKWERGLNFPDIALLEPLGELLGLSVSELISGQRNAPPGEELVRSSLRLGLSQLGRRMRRWRGLFFALAAAVTCALLLLGFLWVRNNTDLLPQPQAVVARRDTSPIEQRVAQAGGSMTAYLFDVALPDDFQFDYAFQAELWSEEGLVKSWPLPCRPYYSEADRPDFFRHQTLILTLDYHRQPDPFAFGLNFLEGNESTTLTDFPLSQPDGFFLGPMEGRAQVDGEDGVVLLQLGFGTPQPGGGSTFRAPTLLNTGTGTGEPPRCHEGEHILLVRMYCK